MLPRNRNRLALSSRVSPARAASRCFRIWCFTVYHQGRKPPQGFCVTLESRPVKQGRLGLRNDITCDGIAGGIFDSLDASSRPRFDASTTAPCRSSTTPCVFKWITTSASRRPVCTSRE
jgi:hypothetical protein